MCICVNIDIDNELVYKHDINMIRYILYIYCWIYRYAYNTIYNIHIDHRHRPYIYNIYLGGL